MYKIRNIGVVRTFNESISGESTIKMAAFFGALAVVVALVGAPMLDKASKEYADNRAFGIDQVITGSIEKSKRYTIRKSVLDTKPSDQ